MIIEPEKQMEVTVKYYLPDNKFDYWLSANALKFYQALEEIHQRCKEECRHADDEKLRIFAHGIQMLIPSLEVYE